MQIGNNQDKLVQARKVIDKNREDVVTKLKSLVKVIVLRFNPKLNFLNQGLVVQLLLNHYVKIVYQHLKYQIKHLVAQKVDKDIVYIVKELRQQNKYYSKYRSLVRYTLLKSKEVTFYYYTQLYSSFLYLIEINHHNKYTFTQLEWQKNCANSVQDNKKWPDPSLKFIKEILTLLGKLKRICQIIKYQEEKEDREGQALQMIFCSYFFIATRIIYVVRLQITLTYRN